MTNDTGLGFFQDAENFLTELSDLESEFLKGGTGGGQTTSPTKTSCS